MIDIEQLGLLYFSNYEPCPYQLKNNITLLIYPIKLKDYQIYDNYSQMLNIKKNEIDNDEIIQMSYLKFLIDVLFKQDKNYENQLIWLINKCFRYDYVKFDYKNEKPVIYLIKVDNKDYIIDRIISAKEFNDIIKIILSQNNPNYDDRYITPEVREMVEEYYSIKYKNTNSPCLEKQKAFVSSKTGILSDSLNEITYREFLNIYNANVDSEIYIGQKIIQGSYKYEVKEDIQHPLFAKKKDKYQEAFGGDYDKFKNKLNQING